MKISNFFEKNVAYVQDCVLGWIDLAFFFIIQHKSTFEFNSGCTRITAIEGSVASMEH